MNRNPWGQWRLVLTAFASLWCTTAGQLRAEVRVDFLIDSDPAIVVPQPPPIDHPGLKPLWLKSLQRPEMDMQRMVAESIARARTVGLFDLHEAVPRLEEILRATDSHPATRFAAARALILLNSRNSSEKLLDASQAYGADLRQLIEPVLAEWDFLPMRRTWIDRLNTPAVQHRDLVLALRGLARVRESSALPQLLHIVNDFARKPDVRLEAALAAGQVTGSGLESQALGLAAELIAPPFVNPLCAIRLLSRHTSDGAKRLLAKLSGHQETIVAAAAFRRLNEIDSELVLPLAESALKSRHPHVRSEGASAYVKHPTPQRVGRLAALLTDPHPVVRRRITEDLLHLAGNPEFHDGICDAAVSALAGDAWQGQEQAALLLGSLDFEPAAARLVELLASPRHEVMVAAAWSLRKLAVPETVPALINHARLQTNKRSAGVENDSAVSVQITLLFETLGVLKASDALPLLLEYVPKQPRLGERPRGAAIWAIGVIQEGARNSKIEKAFNDRIEDVDDVKPESLLVKEMAVIALARMNAVDLAPMLRDMEPMLRSPPRLAGALRWAVKKLTGEELPLPAPPPPRRLEWFLEPSSDAGL